MYQNIFLCHPEIPSLGVLVLFPTTTTTFFFWVHDHYHFFLCHPEIRHSASWRFFQPQQQPFFSGSMITIIFFNVIRRFVTRPHRAFSNNNNNLFFLHLILSHPDLWSQKGHSWYETGVELCVARLREIRTVRVLLRRGTLPSTLTTVLQLYYKRCRYMNTRTGTCRISTWKGHTNITY
jgi:hypothetical protein